jgi:hypothetical protein
VPRVLKVCGRSPSDRQVGLAVTFGNQAGVRPVEGGSRVMMRRLGFSGFWLGSEGVVRRSLGLLLLVERGMVGRGSGGETSPTACCFPV